MKAKWIIHLEAANSELLLDLKNTVWILQLDQSYHWEIT